jgi:hypothetical protein
MDRNAEDDYVEDAFHELLYLDRNPTFSTYKLYLQYYSTVFTFSAKSTNAPTKLTFDVATSLIFDHP